MDIPRPDQARKRRRRHLGYAFFGILLIALITVGLSRLEVAAPSVDGGSLYTDVVKRGPLRVEVHGNGTLMPVEIRWIPAPNQGRIENLPVLAGAPVTADTILVILTNPELEQAAFDAEWQVRAAEAETANLKVQLESQNLNQQAQAATAQASANNAKLEAEVNEELAHDGLVPAITLKQAKAKAIELANLAVIEKQRLAISGDAAKAQIAVQEAKVEQLRALRNLKKEQVEALKIRAGIDGVLLKLGDRDPLQIGQQVSQGANLARVANPAKLKAEIRIQENQAKDVELNQPAFIDTRNGIIPGTVTRVDPAPQNGQVAVDVRLDGPLPKGAKPDLTVDGTIQLERLEDVLFVGRMFQGQPDSTIGVFKVVDGGKTAVRVTVKLGPGSVQSIVIRDGLQVGERVILSDMSSWDGHNKLRLN